MGRSKKVVEVELTKEEESLPERGSITKLSGKHINQFVGDTYNHSIQLAYAWVKERNENKDYKWKIKLVDYYPQVMGGKSILVSYNIEEK